MGTTIRPEITVKNKYWIEKHRYYELKHFCLQYPIWKKAYKALDGLSGRPADLASFIKSDETKDPTSRCAEAKLFYSNRMDMIRRTAEETDPDLGEYILRAVTEGISYDGLKARFGMPCQKDSYYNLYRRFFWLLNKLRG